MMSSHSMIEKLRIPLSRSFAVILGVIILFSSSKWEEVSFTSDILFLTGCILVGIASLGRVWCYLYIAGYKDSSLVTTGPYSISRNPLYFFSLLGALGDGLVTETLVIPSIVLILFAMYYPTVIRSEERRLLSLHGKKFESYCKNTPTFFPKLSLLKEPETYKVNPKIYRRNSFNALWFIWLIGILEIIEAFHETGVLPVYIKIY
jgi:protein-S-isoprenylcysteine O-methyltransferase Ste14